MLILSCSENASLTHIPKSKIAALVASLASIYLHSFISIMLVDMDGLSIANYEIVKKPNFSFICLHMQLGWTLLQQHRHMVGPSS